MSITTDFVGTESYSVRMSRLQTIYDWWYGEGAFVAAATLGAVREGFNAIIASGEIQNHETFASWLSDVNGINDVDAWLADLTFGEGQYGAIWRGTLPASVFDNNSGGAAADPGDPVGRVEDQSGNALNLLQASGSLRGLAGRRPKTGVRNRFTSTEDFTNAVWGKSNVSITPDDAAGPREGSLADRFDFTPAVNGLVGRLSYSITAGLPYTFSVWVKGTAGQTARIYIDTAGGTYHFAETPVTFTGDWQRVTVTLTNTAGNTSINAIVNSTAGATGKTFHAWGAQLEQAGAVSDYQKVGANLRDVTEEGIESVSYLYLDGNDDTYPVTIPDGITGQALFVGDYGMAVTDLTVAPAGAFSFGGSQAEWTGSPPGLLAAVRGFGYLPAPAILDIIIREGEFTETEIAGLERLYIALGGKGLLVPTGPNLLTNPDFPSDVSGWNTNLAGDAAFTWNSGKGRMATNASGLNSNIYQTPASFVVGGIYRAKIDFDPNGLSSGVNLRMYDSAGSVLKRSTATGSGTAAGTLDLFFIADATSMRFRAQCTINSRNIDWDNAEIYRYVPRETI